MSTIANAASYGNDISSLLLSGSADTPAPATGSGPSTDGTAGTGSSPTRDPATRIHLSDKIKDILARASTDQDVANRLKALVESRRSGAANGQDASPEQDTSSSGQSSTASIDQAFEQLSGGTPADDGSFEPVHVGQDFATALKADGYSISAVAAPVMDRSRSRSWDRTAGAFLTGASAPQVSSRPLAELDPAAARSPTSRVTRNTSRFRRTARRPSA